MFYQKYTGGVENMDTLTTVMLAFKAAFQSGISAVTPMALGLYSSLLLIDFAWTMIKAAMQEGSNYIKILVEKATRYGLFLYFIKSYETVLNQVINSLVKVGLTAGGNTLTASNFADPSWLITKGFTIVEPLEKMFSQSRTIFMNMPGEILILIVVYFLTILAFMIIAVQVFITYLEVYIVGTLALIFMGCGVNKHTAFLAEKSIGAVLSFSMKLMTLAFIISVAQPILNGIATPTETNIPQYLSLLVAISAIAFLCWQAPSIAAGLMAGSPSLTAGGVAGAVMAGGAAAIGGAMAAMNGMSLLQGAGALGSAGTGASTAESTIQAASMAGVGDASNSSSPTIATEKSSAPAGGMTGENIASGISHDTGSGATGSTESSGNIESNNNDSSKTPQSSQNSAASVAGKLALANQAIPQESSPQGGVGVTLQHSDD